MRLERARAPPARDRRRGRHHGVGRGVHHPGDRHAGGDVHQPVRGPGGLRRASRPCSCSGCCSSRRACGCERRKLLRDPTAVAEWPVVDFRRADVRRTALLIAALTAVNIVIVLLAGYGGLHCDGIAGLLRTGVPHADAPAVPGLAGRGAFAASPASSATSAKGRAAFVHAKLAGVRQLVMVATNSYPRPIPPGAEMPPGAQAETCSSCHQPGRVDRRSHPRHPRVCRRRGQHRDDDGAADAHERHDVVGACDSLARGSCRSRRVRGDGCGAADDPVRASDRRERPGQGVRRDGREGRGDSRGRAPNDGLHRLPQHGRASHLADAGAGRRSGHRRRDGEPRTALCAARERPAREGDVPQPGSGRARHRRRIARASIETRRRLHRPAGAGAGPSERCRNSIAGTCFPR